jgi:hypothetical protein
MAQTLSFDFPGGGRSSFPSDEETVPFYPPGKATVHDVLNWLERWRKVPPTIGGRKNKERVLPPNTTISIGRNPSCLLAGSEAREKKNSMVSVA